MLVGESEKLHTREHHILPGPIHIVDEDPTEQKDIDNYKVMHYIFMSISIIMICFSVATLIKYKAYQNMSSMSLIGL